MRLIDADKLKPDAEYNAWDGEFTAYSAKQIEEAPTVEVKASGDYIKREDAKSAIRKRFQNLCDRVEVNSVLNEVPSADVVERKRGEWYSHCMNIHSCPFCGKMVNEKTKYCADCGAELI